MRRYAVAPVKKELTVPRRVWWIITSEYDEATQNQYWQIQYHRMCERAGAGMMFSAIASALPTLILSAILFGAQVWGMLAITAVGMLVVFAIYSAGMYWRRHLYCAEKIIKSDQAKWNEIADRTDPLVREHQRGDLTVQVKVDVV